MFADDILFKIGSSQTLDKIITGEFDDYINNLISNKLGSSQTLNKITPSKFEYINYLNRNNKSYSDDFNYCQYHHQKNSQKVTEIVNNKDYLNVQKKRPDLSLSNQVTETLAIKDTEVTNVLSVTEAKEKPVIVKDKKFVIGATYYICPFNNRRLKRYYVCKKFIYTINGEIVRVVIMKQIRGNEPSAKYTLNRQDCKNLHIKFEHGLEVFSMDLDWKLFNNN